MKRYLSFMLALFLVAVFAVSAKAAFTGSYATLDWSNFKWYGISLVPGQQDDPTISWISQGEEIWAENQDNSYNDWADNWSDLEGSVSTSPSEAGAATKSDVIKSYGEVYTSGYAESYAERWGEFKVSGSGLIVFSIPYTISGEIDADPALEEAYLDSYIWLEVYSDSNPSRWAMSDVDLHKDYDNGDVGTWSEDKVISVTLYFNDGETGFFYAGTSTYAIQVVPIPSSIIILTSGIGIIFIRRRYVGV